MSTTVVSCACTCADVIAALLCRMSSLPKCRTVASTRSLMEATSPASYASASVCAPMLSATSLACGKLMSATTTRAPSDANRRAVALPIPPAPPVTIATLSSSLRIARTQFAALVSHVSSAARRKFLIGAHLAGQIGHIEILAPALDQTLLVELVDGDHLMR